LPRRLRTDVPGPDWRTSLDALRDPGPDGIFPARLPRPLGLVVDVGFGRGELLQELASADPERAYLGIEYSGKRVLKLTRRIAKSELDNVRLVQASAESAIVELAPGSVLGFWVNFPDPWPKKRHHRRRLFQPEFVGALALRLVPGGFLEVATDHEEYAAWILGVLSAEPRLENRAAPLAFRREPPPRAPTAYELEWRAQGRPAHYFSYARRADAAPASSSRSP
jgi:tRNA (guanine-N(7)-)-methyltransferase